MRASCVPRHGLPRSRLADVVRLYLSHGASGSAAGLAPQIAGLRRRGLEATAVQLPKGRAEPAMPVYLAAAPPSGETAIGGHSFGGRVASLIAAEHDYGALVLLSYPLHPPGGAERWDERTVPLAADQLPGAAPLRRPRSVRQDRAAAGGRATPARPPN